jgi:hypothetical protein
MDIMPGRHLTPFSKNQKGLIFRAFLVLSGRPGAISPLRSQWGDSAVEAEREMATVKQD